MDPLAEKMMSWSPYTYGFDSPIRFIDVDGLAPSDHIFDTQGRLLYTTKTGNNILVKTSSGMVNISNLPYSKGNNQTIANIAGYYGSEVGIERGTVGVKPDKKKSVAFASGDNIYLNNSGGQIDEDLGNYYNLKNTLVHEKNHLSKGHTSREINSLEHAEVYSTQISDKTFKNTSKDFKEGILGSTITYLQDAYNKEGFQTSQIQRVIETINKQITKFGYRLGIDPETANSPNNLKVNIYGNNKKDQ